MEKKNYTSKLPGFFLMKPGLSGIIAFIILALLTSLLISQRYLLLKREEQQEAQNLVQSSKNRLEQTLDNVLTATQALSFIVDINGVPHNFDSAASAIINGSRYIDALQLVPGGIIKYTYPVKGNEGAFNYNILEDPARNKEAYKAIESGKIFFAGPLELKQGGMAVIGRLPVYINKKFWGFSAAIIRMNHLLSAAGIDTSGERGYYFQLSKINPDTRLEEYFLPIRKSADRKYEAEVIIPEGEWKITAAAVDRYKVIKGMIPIILVCFLFSMSGGLLTFHILKRPSMLEKLVKERTAELQKSEARFRSIFNTQFQLMGLLDLQGNLLEINQTALDFTGYRYEEVIGKPFWYIRFTGNDTQREKNIERLQQVLKKAAAGEFMRFEVTADTRGPEKVHLDVSITPVRDEAGDVTILVLEGRNVTSMKKARKNLQYILTTTTDDFYVIDKNYCITLINDAAERNLMKAWGKPVTAGSNILEQVPPEKKEYIKNNYDRAFTGEKVEYEVSHTNNSKSDWIQVRYLPVNDEAGAIIGVCIITKDITPRKEAEKELLKSKEKFEQIAFATNDALWVVNTETGETWWNRRHYEFYGHNPEQPPLPFEEWEKRIHPDDREKMIHEFNSCIQKNQPVWEMEYRFRVPDNKYAYVHDRVFFYYKDGKLVKMIGSMSDITPRKESEEKLRQSEEKYRSLIEQATDGIVVGDSSGKFIEANEAALKMFGYTRDEFLQKRLEDVLVFGENEPALKFKELREGKNIITNRTAKRKDGSTFILELNSKMLPNGNLLGFGRDITERKKAEIALAESEARLKTILETEPECIKLLDKEGRLIHMNPAGLEMIEAESMDQVKGKQMVYLVEQPFRAGFTVLHNNVFNGTPGRFRFSIVGLKGTKRWMETHAVPFRNSQGKIVSLLGVTRDVTKQKYAEDLLKQSEEKYRNFFEQASDAIFIFDEQGKFNDVNGVSSALLGYTREELKSLTLNDILFPDDLSDNPIRFDLLAKGQSVIRRRRFRRKDGTAVHVEVNSSRLPDGLFLGMVRDLSERIRTQQQLEKEKELSDYIINSLPGVFYFYDYTGKFIRWNKRFEEVTEYSGGEISKMHPLDFFEGNDKELIKIRIAEAFEKGSCQVEAFFYTKSNKKIPYYFTGAVITTDGIPCVIGTGIDITERKEAEEKIKESYRQIRQLSDYLQNVREEERAHIAREIHDELGQQLTVLKMDIAWLTRKISTDDNDAKVRIQNLLEVVDNTVKTVRKISSELRPSMLDDLGLVPALEWHSLEFEKRTGIKTIFHSDLFDLELPSPIVTGLFRIFQESLTNVARHANATHVNATLNMNNDNILMSINDDGKGFVVTNIENKKTLGILGMRERALMMGGEYKIHSIPGKGTYIEVVVPVSSTN